ncbi:hypothetical protein SAMN05877838_3140 [Hoeflea halophila]|uniref:Uncharacterized protein n=1 Tax=Hoeflea halophila TaxID=714899 RepID=A0A286IDS4_9HYPH|nr:hypothetical protein [Hoeflea halophila]SOE18221.1 hypothetical protein SAMN05877838_3140 [Hoeflea halophila]
MGFWVFDLTNITVLHQASKEPLTRPMRTTIHGEATQEAHLNSGIVPNIVTALSHVEATVSLYERSNPEWRSLLRSMGHDLPTSEQSISGFINCHQNPDMLGAIFIAESDEISRIRSTVEIALLTSERRKLRLLAGSVYFREDGADAPSPTMREFYSSGRPLYFDEFSFSLSKDL